MEKRAKEGTSFETGVRMTGFQVSSANEDSRTEMKLIHELGHD